MATPSPGPRPGAPKRSQKVYLTTMASAGAAALGIYALAPNSSCPEGRLYASVQQCLDADVLDDALCREGFSGRTDPVLFRGPTGAQAFAAVDSGSGRLRLSDGSSVDAGEVCRPGSGGSSRSSSSRGSSGSSRGFFSSSDDGSSSHAASSGGGEGGHAVSRGGFGSIGHAFSGGG